jgi:hypothetical protein
MKQYRDMLIGLVVGFLLGLVVFFVFSERAAAPERGEKDGAVVGECGPVPTQTAVPDANIVVDSPWANAKVGQKFVVKGKARVFENQFSVQVSDAEGKVLQDKHVYANASDVGQFGAFEVPIDLGSEYAPCTKFVIQAFDYSAKDGAKQDTVTIPVFFSK